MTQEEARIYANNMTYEEAVLNCLNARCVPYRKATKVKLNELLALAKIIDNMTKLTTGGPCAAVMELPAFNKKEESNE